MVKPETKRRVGFMRFARLGAPGDERPAKPGDLVELEIDGLGRKRQRFGAA
jgi:hypothetical protein